MDTETSFGIRKARKVENARSYLDLCGNDPEPIIQQIITRDETIVLNFTPAIKQSQWSDGVFKVSASKCNGQKIAEKDYGSGLLILPRNPVVEFLRKKILLSTG